MAEKKKKGGVKNRRDTHGVWERREMRGKSRYEGNEERQGKGGKQNSSKNFSTRRPKSDNSGRGERDDRRSQSSSMGYSSGDRGFRRDRRDDRGYGDRGGYRNDRGGFGGGYDRQGKEIDDSMRQNLLVGRNPVTEALRAGRDIEKIFMAEGAGGSISIIRALAKERGVSISMVNNQKLNSMAPGEKHQGVIAEIPAYHYSKMEDIFDKANASGEKPFIVILDELTDPHNVGAIIRSAECMGAHGVVIPNRRACGLTSTVAKSSAGAIEQIPVVRVTNIARTIEEFQAEGIWIAACDMDGEPYYDASLNGAIAIVIGNEGKGVSKLVKEKCDFVVSIPMKGKINSLNASNAAAIVMSEIRRRREVYSK